MFYREGFRADEGSGGEDALGRTGETVGSGLDGVQRAGH